MIHHYSRGPSNSLKTRMEQMWPRFPPTSKTLHSEQRERLEYKNTIAACSYHCTYSFKIEAGPCFLASMEVGTFGAQPITNKALPKEKKKKKSQTPVHLLSFVATTTTIASSTSFYDDIQHHTYQQPSLASPSYSGQTLISSFRPRPSSTIHPATHEASWYQSIELGSSRGYPSILAFAIGRCMSVQTRVNWNGESIFGGPDLASNILKLDDHQFELFVHWLESTTTLVSPRCVRRDGEE